jgi:hypothetical protein
MGCRVVQMMQRHVGCAMQGSACAQMTCTCTNHHTVHAHPSATCSRSLGKPQESPVDGPGHVLHPNGARVVQEPRQDTPVPVFDTREHTHPTQLYTRIRIC